MKFVCLGCIEESKLDSLSDDQRQQMMEECFEYDDQLRRGGHFLGGEALDSARHAVTLRMEDGSVRVTDGPYAETKEMLGGILLLEARDRHHAIELMSKHPGVKMGPFEIRPAAEEVNALIAERDATVRSSTRSAASAAHDEAEIRGLIAKWSKALEAKDLDGLTADYAPNAVLYDAVPAYKVVGAENIRNVWAHCLPCFPETFRSEHRDLVVEVDGDLAFVFGLHHFVTTPADHPCGKSWMRITVGYRRIDGKWKVVHEHVSMPFNPMNGQVWNITDPDTLDMPDYGEACAS